MTDHNTDSVNATAMRNYLDEMQSKATRLAGITKAIAYLENEGACEEGRSTLVFLVDELAEELTAALDIVNRPKGALA